METFGQVGCSVRRPARSGWAQARWVGFHPLFRGGRCNRGVVPLPIRFTARKDGDLRSGCVLGRETTHPFHGGHRRHDQKFHGEERWRPSVKSRARSGDRHDHICFTARKDGDLRSNRVLDWGRWRPSVRSRARRGRRHDQDEGTGGTIRMRTNIFPTGGKLALIAGNKTEKKKGFTTFKWRIL